MGRRLGGVDGGPLPVAARFAHRFEDTPDYGFARCAKSDISDVIVAGEDMAGIRIAEHGRTTAHSQNNRTSDASFISYIVSVHVNVDGNTTTAM